MTHSTLRKITLLGKNTLSRKRTFSALALLVLGGVTAISAHADQLADIKKAGVVKVATFDSNPPFGSVDAKTHEIIGYDVDFAWQSWQC